MIRRLLPSLSLILALTGGLVPQSRAQTATAAQAESHPAAGVVVSYLRYSIGRQFAKAAALIEPESLKGLHADYVRRLKAAPLMQEEEDMCRAVGKKNLEAVSVMTPTDFYIAYNSGLQERYQVTDEVNAHIAQSLELSIISVGEEKPGLVHVVVRTAHNTMTVHVENLETLSLVNQGGSWLVSLSEKMPKVSKLNAAAPATK
jgi:hypothetical protein